MATLTTSSYRRSRSGSRWRSAIGVAAVAAAMALGVTACVDVDMDLVFNDDGSGSATVTISLGEDLLTVADLGAGVDARSLCEEFFHEAQAEPDLIGIEALDWSLDYRFEDGACTITQRSSWDAAQSEVVLADFVNDDATGIRRLPNGGWLFELDGSEFDEIAAIPEGELTEAMALGYRAPTLTFSVTLPGEVVRHNADSVSQSKYTWEIEFSNGPTADTPGAQGLYLETKPSSGLGIEAIVAIVAGALLVLAAIVGVYRRQRAKASVANQDPEPTEDQATTADEGSDAADDDASEGEPSDADATDDTDEDLGSDPPADRPQS